MKQFGKHKRGGLDQSIIARACSAIDHHQRKFAGYLDLKTQYWNRSAKITALAIFCLVFGGIFLLLLFRAITH